MENIDEAVNQKKAPENVPEAIPKSGGVTEKDMENLREAISAEFKEEFYDLSGDERKITAYIHRLGISEIKNLLVTDVINDSEISKLLGKLSFRQINKAIQFLSRATEDPKYNIFKKPE